ncbi:MAG TPA: sodium:proton antiporter [Chthonomonadaceae bacterium]|nr:sodium:proton antiporter [Chthonomonadaceae bacterium]
MGLDVERIEILLLVAAVVAMLVRRLRLPYTVGLVLAGIALAFSPLGHQVRLTQELIFGAFLPPLIFEAAFNISWPELRRDLGVVLTLVTLGVLLAAALTAAGLHFLVGWGWSAAWLFGALIAATDPVAVIATFREVGIQGRLRLLLEAESLFNDGTAAVAFGVLLALAQGGGMSAGEVAGKFAVTVLGGLLCGAAVGGSVLLLAGRTDDHLLETTFTTIAAYGAFLLAEHFHLSGILATLTTGLILGNWGSLGTLTDKGHETIDSFWEYAAFLANSLIFLLIGMGLTSESFTPGKIPSLLAAIVLVTVSRALVVYLCCALFGRSAWRVPLRYQHVLFWGGLRGAVALALALGLPPQTPQRATILTAAFTVVAFSVIVQGLTIKPLLRRLGELPPQQRP